MTKRILFFVTLVTILFPSIGAGQEDPMRDLLTKDKSPECGVYQHNARLLIPRLHEDGQLDSVDMILDYVDKICNDDFFKGYKTLREIDSGKSFDDWCDTDVIYDILTTRPAWLQPMWFDYSLHGDTTRQSYSYFLTGYANELMAVTEKNSMAHVLCRYYSNDLQHIFEQLSDSAYAGSCLQNAYDIKIAELRDRLGTRRGHWSIQTGIWNPLGNADILGPKLEIGGELGTRGKRFGLDLTFLFRFINAKNEYVVRHDGELITTDHFFGGYLGGSLVYQLIKRGPVGLECFTAIGWDGFDAYHEDDESKSINTVNFNFGLNTMLWTNRERTRYVGLQTRYNIVSYDTDGGTDLSGNTLSLNLVFGYIGNASATDEAKRLLYYD